MPFNNNSPGGGGGGGGGAGDASAANQLLILSKFQGPVGIKQANYPHVNASITVGGVAQTILAANLSRIILDIHNISDEDLWISWTGTAAVDSGELIPAGGRLESTDAFCPTGAISIWGPTAGQKFIYVEG